MLHAVDSPPQPAGPCPVLCSSMAAAVAASVGANAGGGSGGPGGGGATPRPHIDVDAGSEAVGSMGSPAPSVGSNASSVSSSVRRARSRPTLSVNTNLQPQMPGARPPQSSTGPASGSANKGDSMLFVMATDPWTAAGGNAVNEGPGLQVRPTRQCPTHQSHSLTLPPSPCHRHNRSY